MVCRRIRWKGHIKNTVKNAAILVLVIAIPLILLLSPILLAVYNEDTYGDEAREAYLYLSSKTGSMSNLTEREEAHMEGVRGLVRNSSIVLWVALALFAVCAVLLICIREMRGLGLGIVLGSCLSLLMLILAMVIGYINFDWLFVKFHQVFFNNNYWLLEPGSRLILLFPKEFFYSIAKRLLFETAIASVIMLAVGYLIRHDPTRRLPGGK